MAIDPSAVMSGLGTVLVAVFGYVWNKMDGRVSSLEEKMASKTDVQEVKHDVRAVSEKVDRVVELLLMKRD